MTNPQDSETTEELEHPEEGTAKNPIDEMMGEYEETEAEFKRDQVEKKQPTKAGKNRNQERYRRRKAMKQRVEKENLVCVQLALERFAKEEKKKRPDSKRTECQGPILIRVSPSCKRVRLVKKRMHVFTSSEEHKEEPGKFGYSRAGSESAQQEDIRESYRCLEKARLSLKGIRRSLEERRYQWIARRIRGTRSQMTVEECVKGVEMGVMSVTEARDEVARLDIEETYRFARLMGFTQNYETPFRLFT
jgi:hypothetical protein